MCAAGGRTDGRSWVVDWPRVPWRVARSYPCLHRDRFVVRGKKANERRRRRVKPTDDPGRGATLRRVRGVIDRLVRDGTAVARSDGTLHRLFPVAASAAEAEALRGWVLREGATRTIEVGLGYGFSALHVCEGLLGNASEAAAHHVAIDPYQAT